jgi:hypothetical protein
MLGTEGKFTSRREDDMMTTKERYDSLDKRVRAIETMMIAFQQERDDWTPVIEEVTDPEELRIIAEGNAEYEADPSSFISLEQLKANLGLA